MENWVPSCDKKNYLGGRNSPPPMNMPLEHGAHAEQGSAAEKTQPKRPATPYKKKRSVSEKPEDFEGESSAGITQQPIGNGKPAESTAGDKKTE